MTSYLVAWGLDESLAERQPSATVSTPEELFAVLAKIAAEPRPQAVDIYPVDDDSIVLQIGVGHAARSFALWYRDDIDDDDGGYAVEPGLDEYAETLTFDYGGEPSAYPRARTRITPDTAKRLGSEFIATGHRPESVAWEANA